ncbi:MAG TPA: IS91 family transposase [Gammaproteobacteria bacterium]|nr:IS91 family transposase [Gammaproteobacteria bacterium]
MHSVGGIISDNWEEINSSGIFNSFQKWHLDRLRLCRTAALGGHIDGCTECGHYRISYNSCRDRHCPSCQSMKREEWIMRQESVLLPVPYFHVVFTLPSELNGLCLGQPKLMYDLLFKCTDLTIKAFSKDPKYLGAKSGMTAVLHTWGQNMSLHPHLHCIIPGGGITKSGRWKSTRSKGKYLFPRNALRVVFKGKFMSELKAMAKRGEINLPTSLREKLYGKNWVVYAKRPFMGPKAVIEYLGRYTHKVAISNYRLKKVTKTAVVFDWKNYRNGGEKKPMSLPPVEFLRRFCLHLLPSGFMRIRHYGILSSRGRSVYIRDIQEIMNAVPKQLNKTQRKEKVLTRLKIDRRCPCCKKGKMRRLMPFARGDPPTAEQIKRRINFLRKIGF